MFLLLKLLDFVVDFSISFSTFSFEIVENSVVFSLTSLLFAVVDVSEFKFLFNGGTLTFTDTLVELLLTFLSSSSLLLQPQKVTDNKTTQNNNINIFFKLITNNNYTGNC